ncbi:hypothetical protein ABW20_dc0100765 [Dactylellina cionopaga]|nr:hypothetical protein ABW20_dc0100765 [Dactylellina cionopaga]
MKAKIHIDALNNDEDGIKYIEACESWIKTTADVDCLRGCNFSSIEDYMDSKLHTVGGLGLNMLLHYCYGVKLTAEELAPLQPLREQAIAHGTYGNDWVSAEIEWITYVIEGRPDLPYTNSVFVIMHTMDVTFGEAKDILVQRVLVKERESLKLRLELEEGASDKVKEYTSACQLVASGALIWHLHNPRYYADPTNPFYPSSEYKISDYKRLVRHSKAVNGDKSVNPPRQKFVGMFLFIDLYCSIN